MQYPNIERQAPGLVETLSNALIVYTKKFQQLISDGVTHLEVLRHQATNYDKIRKPQFLAEYSQELVYTYAEEYLQTFVKNMTNEAIASKLLVAKKEAEVTHQIKTEELYKRLGALEDDKVILDIEIKEHRRLLKEHSERLDAITKELKKSEEAREAINDLLSQVTAENAELTLRIEELESTVAEQASQISDLEETVGFQQLELSTQKQTILKQQSDFDQLKDLFLVANDKLDYAATGWQETNTQLADTANKLETAIAGWKETKEELKTTILKLNVTRMELNDTRMELQQAHTRLDNLEGRLNNLEAQMQALHTDVHTFIERVDNLEVGTQITPELKAELVRDLGNNIALAYATITNLRLVDPVYEQRKNWYVLLKELWKSSRRLAKKFGINLHDHFTIMQIMLKSNPC